MRVIVCEDYKEISEKAAGIVASQIILKPDSVLGLATGSTPVGMYKMLAQMNAEGRIDFSEVKSFNLDEYYPIADDNDQSYHYFMKENLFSKVNINEDNTHILNGLAENPNEECESFENLIKQHGGIDLQILGIGQNGHIGFNEPSASLNSKTHLTDLTENTINANSRFFESIDEVPKQALTMGIGTILNARKIILLASGASKHRVVSALIKGEINTDIPASMLKLHSDVVLICDKEAYSSARLGVDIGGTEIKFGVLDEENNLIFKDSIPTDCASAAKIISDITDMARKIMQRHSINSIGIGTPGFMRNNSVTAGNIPFRDINLAKFINGELKIPTSVSNDANCAALGETFCGAGKEVNNLVMITIGTGIGGGIVINNKIYEGLGAAGEIGHMCIEQGGKQCTCGQNGCWEQYVSASALVKNAEKAAAENTESLLYSIYSDNGNRLDGKLFFKALEGKCQAAEKVFDEYLDYLALGIDNLINIFDPDMIVLSGGITNVGDVLVKPLCEKVKGNVLIRISELKSDAGVVGAAMLC